MSGATRRGKWVGVRTAAKGVAAVQGLAAVERLVGVKAVAQDKRVVGVIGEAGVKVGGRFGRVWYLRGQVARLRAEYLLDHLYDARDLGSLRRGEGRRTAAAPLGVGGRGELEMAPALLGDEVGLDAVQQERDRAGEGARLPP